MQGIVAFWVPATIGSCAAWAVNANDVLASAAADDGTQDTAEPPELPEDSQLLDRQYQGRTLRQWRVVLKNLDHTDPSAIQEIPGLIEIMQDETLPWFTRRQVALTLGRIGEPAARAVPLLIDHLASSDPDTVNWAAKAIALYGPVGAAAAPSLRGLLEDETRSHSERLIAMEALARIGPIEPDVLSALISQLQIAPITHEDQELRIAACDALVLLGDGAAPALPYLMRLLTDDSDRLRMSAATTIGRIGPGASPAIDALVDVVLFDDAPEVSDAAAVALGSIGSSAVPALLVLVDDQEAEVRMRAAAALAAIPSSNAAVDRLHEVATHDESEVVRITAVESLFRLDADASLTIPGALALLESEDRQVRIRAYRLLLENRTHADLILPRVEQLLQDERRYVRDTARRLLADWERTAE